MAIYLVPERTMCSPRRAMVPVAEDAPEPVVSVGLQRGGDLSQSTRNAGLQSAPAVDASVAYAMPV